MADELKKLKKTRGGARPGAGMPKGYKTQKTIAKEEARELARAIITGRLEELLAAQIDNALGIRHLMMRDPKTGRFEQVKGDAAQIEEALATKNAFWIYTKDPSVQAFTDLLNRALDKPAEQVKVTGADVGPVIFKWQD